MVGAKFDTMDPKAMEEQSKMVQHGRDSYCPTGAICVCGMIRQVLMEGVIRFIKHAMKGGFSD